MPCPVGRAGLETALGSALREGLPRTENTPTRVLCLSLSRRTCCTPSPSARRPRLCWGAAPLVSGNPIVRKQTELPIQPLPTPPLPAKTLTLARAHQMAPNLLLDPVLHVAKTATGLSHAEVVDPSTQHRINQGDYPVDRLRAKTSKYLLESLQKRGPRLHPRCIPHTPQTPSGLHSAKVKPQEAEASEVAGS